MGIYAHVIPAPKPDYVKAEQALKEMRRAEQEIVMAMATPIERCAPELRAAIDHINAALTTIAELSAKQAENTINALRRVGAV
jgi:molecular chaperone GrpE (heat shock protein)